MRAHLRGKNKVRERETERTHVAKNPIHSVLYAQSRRFDGPCCFIKGKFIGNTQESIDVCIYSRADHYEGFFPLSTPLLLSTDTERRE